MSEVMLSRPVIHFYPSQHWLRFNDITNAITWLFHSSWFLFKVRDRAIQRIGKIYRKRERERERERERGRERV